MKRVLMLASLTALLVAVPFAGASAGKAPPRHAKTVHATTVKTQTVKAKAVKAKAVKTKAATRKARPKPKPPTPKPAPAPTAGDDDHHDDHHDDHYGRRRRQCDALTGAAHDQCEGELDDDDQCDALTALLTTSARPHWATTTAAPATPRTWATTTAAPAAGGGDDGPTTAITTRFGRRRWRRLALPSLSRTAAVPTTGRPRCACRSSSSVTARRCSGSAVSSCATSTRRRTRRSRRSSPPTAAC